LDIEFSPQGEGEVPSAPPSQGSFVIVPPTRKASVEVNFSPGGSDLPTAAPPKQGRFVEKEYIKNPASTTPDYHATDIEFSPPGREENVPFTIPKPGSFVEKEKGHVQNNDVGQKEINFSPGASDLRTSAPPSQGSFVTTAPLARQKSIEINFIPGGSDLPTAAPPKQGSYAEKKSPEPPKGVFFTESKEINFCPGGSDLPIASPPQQGSYVEKEIKLRTDSEDFVPDESILKLEAMMEAMLESALDDDLKIPPKKDDDQIVPSLSTESCDFVLDDSILNMQAMLESTLIRDLKDDGPYDKEPAPKEEETPLENAEVEAPPDIDDPIVANSSEEVDDFVPGESIAKMEAMIDAVLDDDMDLDNLLKDSTSQSFEQEEKQDNSQSPDDFVPDDSFAKLEAFLDQALDDELGIDLGSQEKDAVTSSNGRTQNKTGPVTESRPKGVPKKSRYANSNRIKANIGVTKTNSAAKPVQKAVPAPKSRTIAATKPPSKKGPASNSVDGGRPTGRFIGTRRLPPAKKGLALVSRSVGEKKPRFIGARRIIPSSKKETTSESSNGKKPDQIRGRKERAKQFRSTISTLFAGTKKGCSTKKGSPPADTSNDYRVPNTTPSRARQRPTKPKPKKLFSGPSRLQDNDVSEPKPVGIDPSSKRSLDRAPKLQQPRFNSSVRSVDTVTSQCNVTAFSSPRRSGRRGCQSKFQPYLHESRGPCELCVFFLSDKDKAMLDATGRHYRVMYTTGGCCKTCEVFPRSFDEPSVRLCRACFGNTHREVYKRRVPKRNILRK
jgi:hypothetical protein